ncbi:hypothetical protein C4J81_07685 [Deltaproteobacteria bacterium Smac51]|nr:hypothetical protein C4J81_07685 [Deltaproteobacteria bacterium Smac51]
MSQSRSRSLKKKKSIWIPTLTALGLTALFLVMKPEAMKGFLNLTHLVDKVVWPMARAMFFMALGLSLAMVIEALGWTVRLGRLASPLAVYAHLPKVAAASFTTALVSNPAANGMLSEALDKGEITPRALAVANLLNGSWPAFIVHLPSTLVIATSFAGRAGLAYTSIMFTAATLRLAGAAILGRLILPPMDTSLKEDAQAKKSLREIWPGLRQRLARRLTTLISVAAPVYYLITMAADLGFFEMVKNFSASHLPDFFLPVEAATLVIFSVMAEFSSGFVAAGAMIQNSTLTFAQATAALVLGNIISTPIRVLRWQLAAFLGFFQVRLGLILIFCNQGFRVLSLVISLFVFWRIFG